MNLLVEFDLISRATVLYASLLTLFLDMCPFSSRVVKWSPFEDLM